MKQKKPLCLKREKKMEENSRKIMDANEAVARIAHKTNEVIAIYPITPASSMGEYADIYSVQGKTNIFGTIPKVIEMQSEGGAAGAIHGALQSGSLTTTFTASQGLLLMLPDMHKIAGELTSVVFHVAARSLASQALSIFGDHSDVMQVRQSGFAMLASCDAQEAQDFALIAQATTLRARVPILHFFDGFRTSSELIDVETIKDEVIKEMIDIKMLNEHKSRALDPEHPVIRGTSQNPDFYFQGRESVNRYYDAFAGILQEEMNHFAKLTKRAYHLYEYEGTKNPNHVIVVMASASKTLKESIKELTKIGYKVGVVTIRLFQPLDREKFLATIPKSVKKIAVLDRTKEPASSGEPLYLEVLEAFSQNLMHKKIDLLPLIIGGRYGLSSKEFTPAMVKAVFDQLQSDNPKNPFTVGIIDDVTHLSLSYDEDFIITHKETTQALFYGLGADGTVGANKDSIKIIGEDKKRHVQGYFVYDSKKSGSMTVSHLRFSKEPIEATYLIEQADFIGIHQFIFLKKYNILKHAKNGATILINTPYEIDETWDKFPKIVQEQIIQKALKLYAINAYEVASSCGLGRRINTVMQTAFFALTDILNTEDAIQKIKESIQKSYGKLGEIVIRMNFCAVDHTISNLKEIKIPDSITSDIEMTAPLKLKEENQFLQEVTARLVAHEGDNIPVSLVPEDGTWPLGTTQYEKRNTSLQAPFWNPSICIQCSRCSEVCPHAVIRSKVFDNSLLQDAPKEFQHIKAKGKNFGEDAYFTIQVSVEDCTGCMLCVEECPAVNKQDANKKAINMEDIEPKLDEAVENWGFFMKIPDFDRTKLDISKTKEAQLLRPLFEFSGACPGCGETPYLKLLSQLFGDRLLIANATGCSSIYGGNLPTTPWATDKNGRGPAWSNSLFEDNAEFGLGFRTTVDRQNSFAKELLVKLKSKIGETLVEQTITADQKSEEGIKTQRENVEKIRTKLSAIKGDDARLLEGVLSYLIVKSIWAVGGDGWAYDIGYGGLDHVLASGININILVLDTGVYSNTGGQTSKATPLGAVAKFSAEGKAMPQKDLALHALDYDNVYVARVAMGANDKQTLQAFLEAQTYDGPSLIIAYSHCIAHGYDLKFGMKHQKMAVESGLWPLFRYNPALKEQGKNPFSLDYKEPKIHVKEYMYSENRFKMVETMNPKLAKTFLKKADELAKREWIRYQDLESSGNLTFGKTKICE